MRMISARAVAAMLLAAGTAVAASVTLPSSPLPVSGTSATGSSFVYSGTLTQADTLTLSVSGNPCLQSAVSQVYCTNAAGVLVIAGSSPVGASTGFVGTIGGTNSFWTYGALLMTISGVGTVQVFPTNAANGLGSGSPPATLSISGATLSSLGFVNFSVNNPTITFVLADTFFGDNNGSFSLTQTPPVVTPPAASGAPALNEVGLIALMLLLATYAVWALRRHRSV